MQMPADCFAFAVRVGGQDQRVVGLQRLGDGADMLLAVGRHLPFHAEILFGIDRSVLGWQVAHMAVRGQNREVGAKIFVDCLGLGGGLDDDDCHEKPFAMPRPTARQHVGEGVGLSIRPFAPPDGAGQSARGRGKGCAPRQAARISGRAPENRRPAG